MKKIFLLLVTALLSVNCVYAQPFNFGGVKKVFNKTPVPQEKSVQTSSDNEMDPSQQAILFFNENHLKCSFDTLFKIKEAALFSSS